jgi:hypothetical protein
MRLRATPFFALALFLASCSAEETLPAGSATQPDIILVSIDTLRPDHLGAYG